MSSLLHTHMHRYKKKKKKKKFGPVQSVVFFSFLLPSVIKLILCAEGDRGVKHKNVCNEIRSKGFL